MDFLKGFFLFFFLSLHGRNKERTILIQDTMLIFAIVNKRGPCVIRGSATMETRVDSINGESLNNWFEEEICKIVNSFVNWSLTL